MRFFARFRLLLGIGVAGVGLVAPPLRAQSAAPTAPRVEASGACPAANAVVTILSTLLPQGTSPAQPAAATVTDEGDAYAVAVGDHTKTYADPSRDCAERARVAAAFIALVTAPPPPPPPPPPPAPRAPAPTAAAPEPAPPPPTLPRVGPRGWLRMDVRGALEVSNFGGVVAGGAIGVAAGRGIFGVHAGCGWLSGSSVTAGQGGAVVIERFPCAIGPVFRLAPPRELIEANVNVELAVGALTASGRGFATTYDATRFEAGARVAVEAILHLGGGRRGFVPVFGLEATYYPMVYDLDVTSRGVVAQTPGFWAGLTVGGGFTLE